MTESSTPPNEPKHRRASGLQTKALAGLVAIMLAAAIVALVFVTNGSGNKNGDEAGGRPSDVGRTSSAVPTTAVPRTSSAGTGSTTNAPSTSAATSSTAAKSRSASAASKPSNTSSAHSTESKKVVYTVKSGDTLTDIGRWYSDHGYLKLYNWNKSVIGKNPDLIFPGQKIIVVDGTVGVARHSH